MSKGTIKRTKRLVSFRQQQRDQVGAEVGVARLKRNDADAQAKKAAEKTALELDGARRVALQAIDPLGLALASHCYQAAVEDLKQRNAILHTAEDELGQKTEKLLAAHRQVRQMTALLDVFKKRQNRSAASKEQREIDDLAAVREVER